MDENDNIKTFSHGGSLLETIRKRPAMYLGESSITALWHYIHGWEAASGHFGYCKADFEKPPEVPRYFADWVGYRLHLDSNYSGFWHKAILSRIKDEHLALVRFFELYDEFFQREPKIVASIKKDCREYTVSRKIGSAREFTEVVELLPESLRIVTYTDDPGFFLVAEEDETLSFNGWFFGAFEISRSASLSPGRYEVHDQVTWDRLLMQSKNIGETSR